MSKKVCVLCGAVGTWAEVSSVVVEAREGAVRYETKKCEYKKILTIQTGDLCRGCRNAVINTLRPFAEREKLYLIEEVFESKIN